MDTKTKKSSLVSKQYIVPFALVTSLFFMWGFARAILDVLNKHFQEVMDITITRSTMVQATTYLGYFLMALPAGLFITRYGYRKGVVLGLLLFGAGSLLFIPADASLSFNFFLVALFIIGCGLVVLEAAANPYITELGDRSTSAARLNLAQSFNGLGCILAPFIVGQMLFSESGESNVAMPYTIMGIAVLAVAAVFSRVKLPEITAADEPSQPDDSAEGSGAVLRSLLSNGAFLFGLAALFCYEISEISINSMFINYATDGGWMSPGEAAAVLSFGCLMLFMVARVLGSWIMSRIAAEKVLTFCAVMTVLGSLAVTFDAGWLSRAGVFVCYAFEAIMFPTIFAITIKPLGVRHTKMAAAVLMMTPLGGAVGTFLMGMTADIANSMSTAFAVPCAGYFLVLVYSWRAMRGRVR